MQISSMGRSIAASETLTINAKIQELRAKGRDVISFAAGEPDFETPDHIKQAALAALEAGHTRYTAASGIMELRTAVAQQRSVDHGCPTQPGQVVVTAGAKQALALAFQAVLEPGDEVLIPRPYWVSFPQQVMMCLAKPVFVETLVEDGFVPTREAVEARITDRTRALVLNSPCNPTGAVYDETALTDLMRLAEERDLWVISDETYEALTYGGVRHVSPARLTESAPQRTIVTCSFSKTYAMTGWRIGYLVGPMEVATAASRIASHTTSNANSIAQRAALAAVLGSQEAVESMRAAFDVRRKAIVDGLRAIPGITCHEPAGAFYAFPNFERYVGRSLGGRKLGDSTALADALLESAGAATVPGCAFGAEGYLRLSYATDLGSIQRGLERIATALESLA